MGAHTRIITDIAVINYERLLFLPPQLFGSRFQFGGKCPEVVAGVVSRVVVTVITENPSDPDNDTRNNNCILSQRGIHSRRKPASS